MATVRATSAFDMRVVVPTTGALTIVNDAITLVGGTRTVVRGDFTATASGVTGTVLGFSQLLGTTAVFTATGVERSARTVLSIFETHDNDRFLAYTLSAADSIVGSANTDYLIGFGGNDTLAGGAGNDSLFGGSDRDTLSGGAGNDFLAGGLDLDLMQGGAGNDTYLVADAGDRVVEAAAAGTDTILSYVSRTITPNVERLVLIGTARISALGDDDADIITGNAAANSLRGGAGNDTLAGSGGADAIEGGIGNDRLTGGAGADVFRFRSAAEARGDSITDFVHGQDRIALDLIDANMALAGNQAFRFIGEAGFTGRAGELSASGTWLRGDVDGDRLADFAILLDHDPILTATDVIL